MLVACRLAKRDPVVQVPDTFRLDGRGVDEVRPLSSEVRKYRVSRGNVGAPGLTGWCAGCLCEQVDVLATPHGSSLFSRGDTQALCTVTLGPPHLTTIAATAVRVA